ncbi:Replication-associated recombination protein A [Lactobacillus helveticus]|nr:Replication-associated recombination protein A [Lactobacillus helveticus]
MSFRTPLADKMRPQTLADVVGQTDLLKKDGPLRKIIEQKVMIPLILWGPPGTGKSSLAQIIARQYDQPLMLRLITRQNWINLLKLIHINLSFY